MKCNASMEHTDVMIEYQHTSGQFRAPQKLMFMSPVLRLTLSSVLATRSHHGPIAGLWVAHE
jgi:hypothetical protein